MTREEFYKLTDILNSEVLGNFMHGGEASEVIAQFEEAVEKSGILKEEPVSDIDFEQELYKAFGQVKDFTLGIQIAKRFYKMGKNNQEHVSDELEEASKKWLIPQLDKSYANYGEAKMMELTHFDGYAMLDAIEFGAKWKKEQVMANTADAMIGLPYENKDGGYTHLIDVSRPLPVGNNKIAIIFKED